MDTQITRLQAVLDDLEKKAAPLDLAIKSKKSKYSRSPNLIESDSFNGHSTQFSFYIKQAKLLIQYLTYALNQNDDTKAQNLLETLENQIVSIHNAINAEQTRNKLNSRTTQSRLNALKQGAAQKNQAYELYEKLSEYRGYEDRLQAMLNEHINTSANSANILDEKAKALHQRLANCRKAILSVELSIQKIEKRR